MRQNLKPLLTLGLALLLLSAQAAILLFGLLHINVSAQYRAVFIKQTETDWVREAPLP
jgi:hypothetical protein